LPPPKAVQQQRQKSASRDSSVFDTVQTQPRKAKKSRRQKALQ
jgi:hypothetical protein